MICDKCKKILKKNPSRHKDSNDPIRCSNPDCEFFAPWVIGEV